MKKYAAFFDIDGTLYREGLITEVFKKLITYELVPASEWYDEVRPAFMKYDRRQGQYDDYLEKMVGVYRKTLVGLDKTHILYIAQRVVEQKGDRTYTFTRDEIKRHKENNNYVIAISGSPLELVKEMAEKHGFDNYRGTTYVTDEKGKYTGEVIPMWDHISKEKAIHEFVSKYDLNLKDCYAYGDTTGDFSMFQLVGHPYAINPTKELLQKIIEDEEVRKKIHIIVERKNMIYEMNIDNIQFLDK